MDRLKTQINYAFYPTPVHPIFPSFLSLTKLKNKQQADLGAKDIKYTVYIQVYKHTHACSHTHAHTVRKGKKFSLSGHK